MIARSGYAFAMDRAQGCGAVRGWSSHAHQTCMFPSSLRSAVERPEGRVPRQATVLASKAVRASAEFDPVDQILSEKATAVASLPEPQAKNRKRAKQSPTRLQIRHTGED